MMEVNQEKPINAVFERYITTVHLWGNGYFTNLIVYGVWG